MNTRFALVWGICRDCEQRFAFVVMHDAAVEVIEVAPFQEKHGSNFTVERAVNLPTPFRGVDERLKNIYVALDCNDCVEEALHG